MALAMALATAACAAEPPATLSPASPAPPSDAPGGDGTALRYTCEGPFTFEASVLDVDGAAETADDPIGAALRAHLGEDDEEIARLPDHGWTLIGRDATTAQFIATEPAGVFTVLLRDDNGWQADGWGQCVPMRALPDGIGLATWSVAPGQSIGPATMAFDALVTEQSCASGRSSEGRVVGPDVIQVGDSVLVTFGVRTLSGDQECPGNPSTGVHVLLPSPLAGRRLLDGSTLPPREPVDEP